MAHHAFGGAAHEDVFQTSVTVSGDDDQVAIEFLCGPHNLAPGMADFDEHSADEFRIDSLFGGKRLKLFLESLDEARLFDCELPKTFGDWQERDWLNHVYQGERPSGGFGEALGDLKGAQRMLREIDRHQNVFQFDWKFSSWRGQDGLLCSFLSRCCFHDSRLHWS